MRKLSFILRQLCMQALRTLLAMLREIFDESAYSRFLSRRRMLNSAQSYSLFLRETENIRERRPRCC